MLALSLIALTGCISSPFEGTWLFQVDLQQKLAGDCLDPDDNTVYSGTSNAWVDIYQATSGEFVVLYGEALVGEASGNNITASWETSYQYDDYASNESIVLTGELDGGVLTGKVVEFENTNNDGDTYECTTTSTYEAQRNTSAPSAYVEE